MHKFKPSDIDFLTEYSRVLQPLASTLDKLQGEHECFYGMLLPNLIQLRHCLSQIQLSNLIYCEPLASAIVRGLQSRFGSLLQLEMPLAKHAILAAIAHPHYKLRWIPPDDSESLRSTFVQAVGIGTETSLHRQWLQLFLPAMRMTMVTAKCLPTSLDLMLLKQKYHPTLLILIGH